MNLIITCPRHMEEEAAGEIEHVLDVMGDATPHVSITDMSGILTAKTALDPVSVSRGIGQMLADEPWSVRYCLRVIPIHRTVKAEPGAIAGAAIEMARRLVQKGDTYRITVEKRNTSLSSSDIISEIARSVDNKVSLEHADATILVEILGGTAGISVLHGSDIFSAERVRRSLGESA